MGKGVEVVVIQRTVFQNQRYGLDRMEALAYIGHLG
jgi:hypothetical protein